MIKDGLSILLPKVFQVFPIVFSIFLKSVEKNISRKLLGVTERTGGAFLSPYHSSVYLCCLGFPSYVHHRVA